MKIAAIFLLVALGFTVASAAAATPKSSLSDCLMTLLQKDLGELLKNVQALVCSYEDCQKRKGSANECSVEEWQALAQKAKEVLERAGCAADQLLLGGKPTVEEIGAQVGDLIKQLQGPVRDILVKLGLEEPVFQLVCGLLGEALVKVADALKLPLPGLSGLLGK